MSIGYRYFGLLSFGDGDGLRLTWLEVNRSWGLALALHNWGDDDHWTLHVRLVFFQIFLRLPLPRREPTPYQMGDMWGFSWSWFDPHPSIHFNWCQRCKIVHLPWGFDWHRTSYLRPDGRSWFDEWADDQRRRRRLGISNFDQYQQIRAMPKWQREYPYTYTLRSGEVQHRTATVEVREYERRRRWMRWTKLGARIGRTIEISFDDEVGERSGTWKGGCVGCSYDLRPGESPKDALRRMERERKFE